MRLGSFMSIAAIVASPSLALAQAASPEPASSPPPVASSARPTPPWTAPPLDHPPSRTAVDEARRRFASAVAAADAGNFQAALDDFTRAYVLTRNPRVLFNISASLEALGNVIDALDALHAFATQAPPDVLRRQRADIASAEVRLQNRIGTLAVESNAADVEIRLDGVPVPSTDLRAGMRMEAGHHHLALSAPGYAPREEDITIQGNAALRETIPLTRLAARLTVECNLAGATVTVDDASAGTTPLAAPITVSQGPHHVRVSLPGYATYESDANVGTEGARVVAQLGWAEPIPAEVASHLVVQLSEPGGHVALDGRGISMEGTDRLPPGTHRLRIERRDRLPLEHTVRLTASRQSSVEASLVPTLDARQDRIARVRLYGFIVGGAGALLTLGFGSWFVINEAVGSPATQPEFRIASATVGGVGLAVLATGIGFLIAAPRIDTGPREPTFRFRAGLGSVGAELHF